MSQLPEQVNDKVESTLHNNRTAGRPRSLLSEADQREKRRLQALVANSRTAPGKAQAQARLGVLLAREAGLKTAASECVDEVRIELAWKARFTKARLAALQSRRSHKLAVLPLKQAADRVKARWDHTGSGPFPEVLPWDYEKAREYTQIAFRRASLRRQAAALDKVEATQTAFNGRSVTGDRGIRLDDRACEAEHRGSRRSIREEQPGWRAVTEAWAEFNRTRGAEWRVSATGIDDQVKALTTKLKRMQSYEQSSQRAR